MQALADRQAALDEADRAAEREQAAQRRLERAKDDLEQAQRRGRRVAERAEELSADASGAIAAVAPTVALASLGGPAIGIGGGSAGVSFGDLGDLPRLLSLPALAAERDRLRDIERDYQVEEEEAIGWEPPSPFSLRTEPEQAARTEAELLDKCPCPS